ncbi:hypothetical protein [Hymenobacter negativus]|uniref:Uncharacterized protein n=1 Tax=Hymenobacter negativus TaxID=2795026 RepID=A0ABS3QNJ5_9BACT|nr:hypothetical protein [Hymenobacter negativus]MBO2012573.1 hypothetical protein [Hymenobacter negativus]
MDFLTLIATDADVLQFRDVKHIFYTGGKGDNAEVRCRLAVTPQVGEAVDLFFNCLCQRRNVRVNNVTHQHLQYKALVLITLRPSYYDAHFTHLLARAWFENKWPLEAWEPSNYAQKELLRKIYPKG